MKFHSAMASVSLEKDKNVIDEAEYKKEASKISEKGQAGTSSIDSDSIKESEKLIFRGFKNDYFGLFAFGSVVVTTLLFFVFLGCLVGDYCRLLIVSRLVILTKFLVQL
jgi:cation-transporting ATPase 13A3/4/5